MAKPIARMIQASPELAQPLLLVAAPCPASGAAEQLVAPASTATVPDGQAMQPLAPCVGA